MTRKKDSFWEYAERLDGRFKCNFCERDFAGGVPRVKSHLSGIKGRDIDVCTVVPRDVQLAAAATIKGVHKRPKTEAFSSNSDENSSEVCDKNDSSLLDILLAKFFLLNNIDCGVVKSPSFIDFVNAVAAFGPAYNLPSHTTLETAVVPSLLGDVKAHLSSVRESWEETGCTLISDIWCDEKENKSFVNIIAYSRKGAVLLNTFEIPKDKLTSDFFEIMISFSVQKIGANNVVQYINGAQSVGHAGSLLANDYPHISVTRCVADEIQSLFEEVYSKIEWIRVAFDNSRCLVSQIYGQDNLLSLMRKYTDNRELRQPHLREFSSNYKMLLSIVEARSELLQLVQSPEWLSFGYETKESVKEVTEIIHSSEFWNQVQEAVMALEPLCVVLYLVDRYGSSSGYLYGAMEIATEKIRRIYDVNPTKYHRLWEIFDSRKSRIVHPIHAAAAFLNPAYTFRDKVKVIEVMNFVVRHLVADEDKEALVEQMMVYHSREPELFSDIAKIMLKTCHPCKWWDYCGHKLPVLRKYAIRILSQPCSSLVCKQSLTAFESAQMEQQQRFAPEAPHEHLSLRMNMILTAKFSARDTSDKAIDLTELYKLKLIDQGFSTDMLNRAEVPHLDLRPCHRSGFSSEQYADQKHLQLQFVTRISSFQVTGQEIRGEHGSPIHVFLVDPVTGDVVQDDRLSILQLTVSALQGDFDEEARNDWTREDFEENEITDVPIMTGDLQVTLKKGMGTLGAVTFNYDSSITRSGKFRIGVKTATGDGEGIHIHEGISNAFVVEYVKATRMHDATANQTRLPDDSQPESNMDELARLWSPLQNIVDDETVLYDQFFGSTWNAEVMCKHKQKVSDKLRQAATGWLKLKAILQWAILRRLVARKRAQRIVALTIVQKRLEEWDKGAKWTTEEHRLFLSGMRGLGKHDWSYISEKHVQSKTPKQVESHAKKYFDYESRVGVDNENNDMLVPLEPLLKEEQELMKPTDSRVGDPAKFPRCGFSQLGHSMTLFPSLLNGHGAEPTDNEVSQKGVDIVVLEQSEPLKSTDSNAGESALNLERSPSSNQLTLFPKLLTEHGDEIDEDFIMVDKPELMLSMRPAEADELNDTSTHSSVSAKQMHHPTANVTHPHIYSTPSTDVDWEIVSWSPSQMLDKYENEYHRIAPGNEHQLRIASRKTATRWLRTRRRRARRRSSLHWLNMFTSTDSGRAKQKVGSQLGEDGEEVKTDQSNAISGGEPGRNMGILDDLDLTSSKFCDHEFGSLCSLKHPKTTAEPLRMKTVLSKGESVPSYLKWSHQFTLRDLEVATNEFSQENFVGEGGYGSIYRGNLTNGMPVAVKKLLNSSGLSNEEFRVKVDALTHLQHKNLVQLLGFCIEGTNRLLVYEYVKNGNLDQWLRGPPHQFRHLSWEARMKIGFGVAKALAYLHEETEPRVIHKDIKCSNILIDEDFNAKISDFGIAKLLEAGKGHVMTRPVGTFGYVDPEYAGSSILNEKSDIYSFGIVLLKLITGRDPNDHDSSTQVVHLVEWLNATVRSGQCEQLVDPNIETRPSTRALKRALLLAMSCLDPDADKRPKMSQVVQMLTSGELYNPREDQQHGSRETEDTETEPPQGTLKTNQTIKQSSSADNRGKT